MSPRFSPETPTAMSAKPSPLKSDSTDAGGVPPEGTVPPSSACPEVRPEDSRKTENEIASARRIRKPFPRCVGPYDPVGSRGTRGVSPKGLYALSLETLSLVEGVHGIFPVTHRNCRNRHPS